MTEQVVVVLASRGDVAAAVLADRHADARVRVMSPDDLSREGWVFHLDDPARATTVLNGRPLPVAAIAGVVTRLPAVTGHDLPHIAPADRGYVAAEMNAFLLAWLTSLDCPVVNRPTPDCLSGPYWRQERWVMTAQRLEIPARPVHRGADTAGTANMEPGHIVTIVGEEHFGAVDDLLIQRAHALADAVGTELLTVTFDGQHRDARFVGAGLWPDLGDARIGDAVFALIREQHRSPGRVRTVQ